LLEESISLINANKVWELKDDQNRYLKGEGIKIAILDTGVDYRHPDLRGDCFGQPECKVVGGYDVMNKDDDPIDDQGHGTHVVFIAAGNGSLKGVAPEAKTFAYKVLNEDGSGNYDDIIEVIERALDPNGDRDISDRVDVINLSLGGIGDQDDPLSQAVDNAVEASVVVVVAAGNSGPDYETIFSPGVARKAITVGAITKSKVIASFSSRGSVIWKNQALIKPDVVAPGKDICAVQFKV